MLREWAYAYIYPSSQHRTNELTPWMQHYNFHRPHSATEDRPPVTRLGLHANNVLRNYSISSTLTLVTLRASRMPSIPGTKCERRLDAS